MNTRNRVRSRTNGWGAVRGSALLCGVLLLVVGLLVVEGASAAEFGSEDTDRRILIASENTAFKNRLVSDLIDELDDGVTYIRLIDHMAGELIDEDPNDYGAVLVINSGVGARVRPWVTAWMDSAAQDTEHVILLTTQRTRWTPRVDRHIDSMTSASMTMLIDDLSEDLVRRIEQLL